MSAVMKPDNGGGFGPVGLVRMITENAPDLAKDLRAESQQLREKAESNDRLASVLDRLNVVAEAYEV